MADHFNGDYAEPEGKERPVINGLYVLYYIPGRFLMMTKPGDGSKQNTARRG